NGSVVGEHGHHDVTAAGFRDGARQRRALPDQRVRLGGVAVVDGDGVTRIDKVGGHAAAHVPQADKSDIHGFPLSTNRNARSLVTQSLAWPYLRHSTTFQ